MIISIDATPLLVRSAGVKNYLYHWIHHLRRQAGSDTIRTFPELGPLAELNHDASLAGRWRTYTALAALAISNYTPAPAIEWLTRGADLFHATVLTQRPPRRSRLTATIHDVTAWTMPELHPTANRRAEEHFAALARRADGLIAVSQCTKDDAVRVLGLDPDKIRVVHSGVAQPYFDPPAEAVEAVRDRYGLAKPYVLSIGTVEPRKNLDVLMDAYAALPASVREEHELVVAGPLGWATESTRARLAQVRYLGYIPEPELPALTAGARVLAYPSLYEGFGFPVAQALAAGVPVVASNVSSLPEIAGDAAVLVDPRSASELREALLRVLDSAELRGELRARGRARAVRYRWETCASRSLEFFRSL